MILQRVFTQELISVNEIIIGAIAAGVGAVLAALGTMIVNIVKAKNEPRMKELELGKDFQSIVNGIADQLNQFQADCNEAFEQLEDKIDNYHVEQKAYNIAMIRHDIVQVYEFYKEKKEIPLPVYQSVLDLYDKYAGLGGNSFVHEIVDEMKEWNKE